MVIPPLINGLNNKTKALEENTTFPFFPKPKISKPHFTNHTETCIKEGYIYIEKKWNEASFRYLKFCIKKRIKSNQIQCSHVG